MNHYREGGLCFLSMRFSFSRSCCSKGQSLSFLPLVKPAGWRSRWACMDSTTHHCCQKDKIIVIMGATGTGKSRLSIELATRFPSEIINSDKMQVYRGLDITTNKIPMHERLGIPHHLLDEFNSSRNDLSPAEFRSLAATTIKVIQSHHQLPLVVGGSNSFIHALVVDRYDTESDVFHEFHSISTELRYNCCFLWVDVSLAVLPEYLLWRVNDMLNSGMFEELAEFYDSEAESDLVRRRVGIRKAIGVSEFDHYFSSFPPGGLMDEGDLARRVLFEETVEAIKDNTCQLAKRQIGKILRLRSAGWDLQRLDATEAFEAVLASDSDKASVIWKKEVVEPSVKIVKRFLE